MLNPHNYIFSLFQIVTLVSSTMVMLVLLFMAPWFEPLPKVSTFIPKHSGITRDLAWKGHWRQRGGGGGVHMSYSVNETQKNKAAEWGEGEDIFC